MIMSILQGALSLPGFEEASGSKLWAACEEEHSSEQREMPVASAANWGPYSDSL